MARKWKWSDRADKWVVYALTDPLTGEVRYIGQTKNLMERYRTHLSSIRKDGGSWGGGIRKKEKWITSLLKKGLMPGVLVLEYTSASKIDERECHWVNLYLARGARLTNWQLIKKALPHDYQI